MLMLQLFAATVLRKVNYSMSIEKTKNDKTNRVNFIRYFTNNITRENSQKRL